MLAACRVRILIVRVLAQTQMRHRLTDNGLSRAELVVVSLLILIHCDPAVAGFAAEVMNSEFSNRDSAALGRQGGEILVAVSSAY